MAQDYKDQGPIIQGKNQLVREYVGNLQTNTDVLRSNFSGSSAPTSPTVGQLWFNTLDEKFYKFTSSGWNEIDINTALFNEVKQSRGLLSNLHTRLDVALNPDGTLKNPVAAEIDEWKENAIAITVLSDNSFSCSGDLTPIFTKNRAVKVIYSDMSFKYSYVKTSEYSDSFGITSVTIKDDYINADTTAIYYALIQHSIPFINESLDNINESKADKLENGHGIVRSVNNQYADDNGNVNLSGIDTGMIIPFAGNGGIPAGFLLCNGASVLRDTYPDLFKVIGTTYGSVDDTHFNLPDLIGRFAEGSESAGGYKEAGLPNATGSLTVSANTAGGYLQEGMVYSTGDGSTGYALGSNVYLGSRRYNLDLSKSNPIYGNSDTVQPPAVTMRYIIKAFAGASATSTDIEITKVANDMADKANRDLSNLSEKGRKAFFPSATFVGIPITGSATRFTAPANGYAAFNCSSNNTDAVVDVLSVNKGYIVRGCGANGSNGTYLNIVVLMPITKGDTIEISYQQVKEFIYSRFYYAEGEV